MDEKRVISSLNGLINAGVLDDIIDPKRFVASKTFNLLISYALLQISEHNNTSVFGGLLQLLEKSEFYRPVLLWTCMSTKLHYSISDGAVRIMRKNNTKICFANNISLDEYCRTRTGTKNDVVKEWNKSHKAPPSLDALDSRDRLPGSYGTGRRR